MAGKTGRWSWRRNRGLHDAEPTLRGRAAGMMAGAVLGAVLLAPTLAQAQANGFPDGRTIVVTGEGEVAAAPDMAYVSVGVTQEADTAQAALWAMSDATAAVLTLLQQAGIAPEDIQTGQLNLEPRYADYDAPGGPRITGFVATTMLDLRVRDLDDLGAVLDSSVRDGANRLGGIRFDIADADPVREAARRDAVADAASRAALYAEAAGVALGEVQTISEVVTWDGPRPMMEASFAMDRAASLPIAPGEVNLTARVTMVYRIAD